MQPPVPTASAAGAQPAHHTDVAAVMRAHEQVMQQLLDTHSRVMAAAFATGTTPRSQAQPAAVTAHAPEARPAALPDAQSAVQPAAPPPTAATEAAQPAAPDAPINPAPATKADQVRDAVLRIVGERTGYPPDMLDVNADLEADLGIDSIKRVEIAGRLRKAFPHIGATADSSKVGNLANLRTLSALIDQIESVPAEGATEQGTGTERRSEEAGAAPLATGAQANHPSGDKQSATRVHVPRFMPRMEGASTTTAPGAIRTDGVYLVTDDENGLADAVAATIVELGGRAVIVGTRDNRTSVIPRYQVDFSHPELLRSLVATVRQAEGRVAGIVHLLPLRHRTATDLTSMEAWRRTLQDEVKALFFLVQAAAEDLQNPTPAGRALVLAAVDTNNAFPGHGGIVGLINTLATEWPALVGRTLALDRTEPLPTLAKWIGAAMQDHSPARFVHLDNGQRRLVRIEPAAIDPHAGEPLRIGPDWVILLTGGGCGITGQVAMELAERFKPTLILTGRSPEPEAEEASATRGVDSPAELRRLLAASLAGPNGKAALADVEAAYRRLCRERELRATLTALRATGARIVYRSADVRDEKTFGATIDGIYAEFGRLDGVIHGAGVIEDKRIEDKTPESFDRVFDTKADGAFVLTQRLRLDAVQFVVFFSSVAYLGNAGQSDYAAANGVLNALARDLDRRMPGRVVSLLWGPWQSAGMASEEVQRRFRDRGVQIIPVADGRRCLVEELLHGPKGAVEVIYGDAPYTAPTATPAAESVSLPLIGGPESVVHNNGAIEVACVLDPSRQAYLRDHMLDGKPVFPAAMAMELMAEAAQAAAPDFSGDIEVVGLEVLNGIVLADNAPLTLRVAGQRTAALAADPPSLALTMRITSPRATNRDHYHAEVRLDAPGEPPRLAASEFAGLEPFPLSVTEVYRQWLFQGRCFAGIEAIEGIRSDAIAGRLQSVAPELCLPTTPAGRWSIDPTVVDASLQLVILWERHWHAMTPLPLQIARFRLFESLSGQPIRCLVKATAGEGGDSLTADIFYTDRQGRVLAVMEGLQCACTKALNRLGDSAGRQTATTRRGKKRAEAKQ
jgi:NAD(P)-dependent dehydrogenase (short-subunit alcohol dehydrogenase family)/acyl carrier protein